MATSPAVSVMSALPSLFVNAVPDEGVSDPISSASVNVMIPAPHHHVLK